VGNIEFPDCPDWVPNSVLEAAKELFPFSPHVIRRLLTDPRMESVWQTLRQKSRTSPGRYKHSRAPDWPDALEGLQQQWMRELFVAAAASYYHRPPVITRRELVKLRKPYFDAITRLENAKRSLQGLGIGRKNEISVIDGLILECKMQADALANSWTIIGRDIGNPQLYGSLKRLVQIMKSRFNSPMYGITANIASVALDRKVTVGMVRQAAET
jgi:hypothetical protein